MLLTFLVKHKKSRGKKGNGNKLDQMCCRFGDKAGRRNLCSFSNLTSATGIQQVNFVKRVLEKCQEREPIFRSCCLNSGQRRGYKGRERKKELRKKNKHKKNNRKMAKKFGRKPHKHNGRKRDRKTKKLHGWFWVAFCYITHWNTGFYCKTLADYKFLLTFMFIALISC